MDVKHCVSGKNEFGQWHIACDTVGAPALLILQNMRYTDILSPLGITYFKAARWVCEHGGTTWTTNASPDALAFTRTCRTLPPTDPF